MQAFLDLLARGEVDKRSHVVGDLARVIMHCRQGEPFGI